MVYMILIQLSKCIQEAYSAEHQGYRSKIPAVKELSDYYGESGKYTDNHHTELYSQLYSNIEKENLGQTWGSRLPI